MKLATKVWVYIGQDVLHILRRFGNELSQKTSDPQKLRKSRRRYKNQNCSFRNRRIYKKNVQGDFLKMRRLRKMFWLSLGKSKLKDFTCLSKITFSQNEDNELEVVEMTNWKRQRRPNILKITNPQSFIMKWKNDMTMKKSTRSDFEFATWH